MYYISLKDMHDVELQRISGPVVECSSAKRAAQVRFPADAIFFSVQKQHATRGYFFFGKASYDEPVLCFINKVLNSVVP